MSLSRMTVLNWSSAQNFDLSWLELRAERNATDRQLMYKYLLLLA